MTPHVGTEGICTGVRLAFASTVDPLTGVALLSAPDVLVVEVLHQPIHVTEVTSLASIPQTNSNLVRATATVIIVLVVTKQTSQARGIGDLARAVGGDGGSRRSGWRGIILN